MGFGVWGLGFGVWGLGFGVWGLGFGVWGLGFGVWGLGFGVWGLGFGVWGLGFGVWGLGFGVWGLGFIASGSILAGELRRSPDRTMVLLLLSPGRTAEPYALKTPDPLPTNLQVLVAKLISPQEVYTFGSKRDYSIPKSAKCAKK